MCEWTMDMDEMRLFEVFTEFGTQKFYQSSVHIVRNIRKPGKSSLAYTVRQWFSLAIDKNDSYASVQNGFKKKIPTTDTFTMRIQNTCSLVQNVFTMFIFIHWKDMKKLETINHQKWTHSQSNIVQVRNYQW